MFAFHVVLLWDLFGFFLLSLLSLSLFIAQPLWVVQCLLWLLFSFPVSFLPFLSLLHNLSGLCSSSWVGVDAPSSYHLLLCSFISSPLLILPSSYVALFLVSCVLLTS